MFSRVFPVKLYHRGAFIRQCRFLSNGMTLRCIKSHKELPTLTLFTKEDCSLCDEAMDILKPHLSKVRFQEVDITQEGNEQYYQKYRFDIPVFHLNGRYLMKHRADLDIFLQRLKDISTEATDN